jgi:hypothetical protein
MRLRFVWPALLLLAPVLFLHGQTGAYKLQTAERAVPKDLGAAIQKLLSPLAVVLTNAQGQEVAEFWHRKEIPAAASDAQVKAGLNYRAIKESEVIGAVRFKQDWSDYRKQKIKAGVYTMRLGYQPLDGDHAGSSQYTEFVLLLKAGDDAEPKLLGMEEFYEKSMAAAGTTHPAVLMLFPNPQPAAEPKLADKGNNHLVLNTRQTLSIAPGKSAPLGFGLTVVGSSGS